MRFAGVDLADAVRMAVEHPARLLGLDPGGIEPGMPADLVQFDLVEGGGPGAPARFEPRCTIVDGESVWGNRWHP
jgi:cytosine/adenosine deaminase-related metal-dependent hydrolase